MSRKYTQLSDVQYSTARQYIDEIANKYPEGTGISTSPSVLRQQEAAGIDIAGQQLSGQLILEIPPQVRNVPQNVIDYARSKGVVIRTSEGVVIGQ